MLVGELAPWIICTRRGWVTARIGSAEDTVIVTMTLSSPGVFLYEFPYTFISMTGPRLYGSLCKVMHACSVSLLPVNPPAVV